MIDVLNAVLLGVVEGLTEFLPISSTGHLILATHTLGLQGEAVKTFEIVIQAGALVAVVGLYRPDVLGMMKGLMGRHAVGARLLQNLILSFLPAGVAGLVLHDWIKAHLFNTAAVAAALGAGGLFMIGLDARTGASARKSRRQMDSITPREAFLIGLAQCLALWPGTSRAMVTIAAGMLLGLRATAAAEYGFLLALPTLGAATLFDAVNSGPFLLQHSTWLAITCGFAAAILTAALAIRSFIRYLTRRGLAPFGWYRIGLALAVWLALSAS